MSKTVLITGANRGIGLEFTRQYVESGWQVYACCRAPNKAHELMDLELEYPKRLSIYRLDVGKPKEIKTLAALIGDVPIDILLNNAGIFGPNKVYFGDISAQPWLDVFNTNTIAPVLMTQAFVENIAASERKIIANMSSEMASITENTTGRGYMYRSSKAAMNAVMKSIAIDLAPRDITVVQLNPGWVKTDMGGENAPFQTSDSVARLINLLSITSIEDTGKFLSHDGRDLPW